MTLTTRTATRDDLPAILAMLATDTIPENREILSDPIAPCYLAAFDAVDASPDQLLLVGEIDGAVIATLQLSFLPGLAFRGGTRGQIESVRVTSELRGRGIGAQLIDAAVAICRERGCFMVQLMSSASRHDAHRFYERLGWARSHVGFKLKLED